MSQYADDTVLFLNGKMKPMQASFRILDQFAIMSGLKVNVEKTNAIWIGSMKDCENLCEEINVNWIAAKQPFTILGIEFSTDLNSMILLNYNKIIPSLRGKIFNWSKRHLTVLGRIAVVKSLLLSELTYLVLTILDPPCDVIKELNILFFNFIWKGHDRVTRNQIIQDYGQGGLRMVDVRAFCRCS